jgi:glutathione S-transferase
VFSAVRRVFTYRERFGFPDAIFTPPVLESIQAKWTNETLPRHLGFFVHRLAQSPTGWIAGTLGPSVADILLASLLRNEITPLAPLPPPLADLVDRVYSLPAVVEFKLAEAKETRA